MHLNVKNLSLAKALVLMVGLLSTNLSFAQTGPISTNIDAAKTGPPISKYLYGQFLEHIGGIVNNGIWAEMLDDRKFYFPIDSHPPAEPENPGRRRIALRRWKPIGADEFVTMDTERPYVGEHTPRVTLNQTEAHGIQQAGLAVRNGRNYSGRIVLAGDARSAVKVSLVWGNGPSDRQTISLNKVGPDYHKFPITFAALGDSDDGRLEIVGTGSGSFHIGAVSLMPANNVEGFRAEVVAALKQLHSGVYRFPGGNFVSGHGLLLHC